MLNSLAIYKPFLHSLMKLAAGMEPKSIEIEAGTILNFWSPKKHNPKKPVVVFLHGFALDGILTWQFQVLALAKTYNVYVPDLVFFGGSITDKADRSPEFQAECIAKGLRKLGVEKCNLVGLSYGGMVGFKMAEMYPDLVESMVVTCSVMALTESVSNTGLQRIGFSSWADYLLPDSVNGVKVLLDVATYKLPSFPNFIYKDIFETMFDNRKEKTELLEALVVSDKEYTVPHFSQTIHLLWGENDRIFDIKTARNLKQQVGEKARLEYIEKSGHLVNVERPCVYNRHLKRILDSLVEENGHRK